MTATPKKIYIAGPEVFFPDLGKVYYDHVRAVLEDKGVVPLIPLDNEVSGALKIRNANIDMIKASDAIIADLSPFRGKEPDCGTTFELGYAAALGKVLLPFTADPRPLFDKYGGTKDNEGNAVEDFQLPYNLMLSDGVTPVFTSFDDAFNHFIEHHL